MRKQKTIALGDTLAVKVEELRIKDIKNLMSLMNTGGDFDFTTLLTTHWDDALDKFGAFVSVTGGSIEDLSFSEVAEVQRAFMEVNTDFFAQIAKLGLNLGLAGQPLTPN